MPLDVYTELARVYDTVMPDRPYAMWHDFWLEAARRYGKMPVRSLADIGCGTGTLALKAAEEGFVVFGIDGSPEMLSRAQEKAERADQRLFLLEQDIRDLDLPEPVDVAVSFCDTLNYIQSDEDLGQVFLAVQRNLKPGGLFLFDVHSLYKVEKILPGNVSYHLEDDVCCIWETFVERNNIFHEITCFIRETSGLYRRHEETHEQRYYATERITHLLGQAGFESVDWFSDFTWEQPGPASQRLFGIAR